MRTSKLISTISYNTKEFLDHHLRQLYADHKISDFIYIYHYAEDDELKNHFHVVIKPNCLFDTMDLQDYFKEYDPNNPLNPLGMTDFKISKMDDWILYDLHYPPYLAWKCHFISTNHFFRIILKFSALTFPSQIRRIM